LLLTVAKGNIYDGNAYFAYKTANRIVVAVLLYTNQMANFANIELALPQTAWNYTNVAFHFSLILRALLILSKVAKVDLSGAVQDIPLPANSGSSKWLSVSIPGNDATNSLASQWNTNSEYTVFFVTADFKLPYEPPSPSPLSPSIPLPSLSLNSFFADLPLLVALQVLSFLLIYFKHFL
jgi:hypothetical protein